MRLFSILVTLALLLGLAPARAADPAPGCDSCAIKVDSLDQPTRLVGKWLFTRDDSPANAAVDVDTSDTTRWRLVKAPGPWKHAYDDHRNFTVGWYRGAFDFAPNLVGQDVVVLVNAYMGRTKVWIDGQEVYERPFNADTTRYYSIQPIPVRFRITKPHQTIAIRVDTPLMTGIYMLPFELRKYGAHDGTLVFYQVWGGELRLVIGFVVAFFGLFFLLVYSKTRHALYLTAALASLVVFPFFAAPADFLLGLFEPERLTYIHYLGLYCAFFFYLFTQFFHRFTPRINKVGGALMGAMALVILSMTVHPDLDLFQHVRSLYFVMMLSFGLGCVWQLVNAVRARKAGARVLLVTLLVFLLRASTTCCWRWAPSPPSR